jgi:cytochrome P450
MHEVVSRQNLCSPAGIRLRVPLPDVVAMQTRQPNLEGTGEIPLRRLVKEALRMRPPASSSVRCARRSA